MTHMKKTFFLGLSLLILSACAGLSAKQEAAKALVGGTKSEVIAQMGEPTQVAGIAGDEQLIYKTERTQYVPPGITYGARGQVIYTPGYTLQKTCLTTFKTMGSFIIDVAFEGNDC